MRTFSKLVFICNCCFIIAAIMRLVELKMGNSNYQDAVVKLPVLVASVILLGLFFSFILNFVFVIVVAIKKLTKKPIITVTFFLIFNLLMLPIQLWYHFIWQG